MGRWGYRLFEGDQDLDIASDINRTFGEGDAMLKPSHMVHQTDLVAGPDARAFYASDKYVPVLAEIVANNREKLDSGLGDQLFAKYRGMEDEFGGKYRLILVGALMMRAGAKIRDEDLQHLRDLVSQINCNEGFTFALADEGFRGPGKRQFLAALDNYRPGVPRSFADPSCFGCGKMQADIQKGLDKCSRCMNAWYCNRDCQKAHWKAHKPSCIPPERRYMLNV